MVAPTPEQRSAIARKAALTRWAHEDPTAQVQAMLLGQMRKWLRQVDENAERTGEQLTETQRWRRAKRLRRVYMSDLARKRWGKAS